MGIFRDVLKAAYHQIEGPVPQEPVVEEDPYGHRTGPIGGIFPERGYHSDHELCRRERRDQKRYERKLERLEERYNRRAHRHGHCAHHTGGQFYGLGGVHGVQGPDYPARINQPLNTQSYVVQATPMNGIIPPPQPVYPPPPVQAPVQRSPNAKEIEAQNSRLGEPHDDAPPPYEL
ncbi:hypothetical protein BZG36_01311 [Bifiguratus adelaidae]|uniref:Uncharacterized protein n=1 Tax=Bifiguratus adelaidae TaxID=1938954 RepID=A0A261Y544_9FUNG|nr:hypothetical protein BZG36_01311 [Bifiguratus adelaidae]